MFSFFYFFFGLICVSIASTLLPVTAPSGCAQNGKTYATGESFQPTPCEHCFCDPSGRVICAITDCFFTPCVDAVHDPTKCCPTCPNGENCKHRDGTIIKKGDVYKPDNYTTCMCPTSFHFGPSMAICAAQMIDPPVHVVVDQPHVG